MTLPRFYAPGLDPSSPVVTLPADEARHLARVLRLGTGDQVSVFDGRGTEYSAVVEAVAREAVSLRLVQRVPARERGVQIVVAQAVLKGASMDEAVRDATMMGAGTIVPLLTAHTDVKPSVAARASATERWQRVALASAKQCRRARLPRIEQTRTFADWLAQPPVEMVLMFVEPEAGESRPLRTVAGERVPARAAVLLGPEGGWSREELDAARAAGCLLVSLGPLTLRAESMPVAALAAVTAIWEV
jgi:16S rRNA (uracil1498-N3)-methyltransferase